jgi:hypothetical protein
MKLQVAEAEKRLNVEHRTPNIERPILMTLRFIDFIINGTKACGETFGLELTAEGLSRIEFSRVDTFCSVFFYR